MKPMLPQHEPDPRARAARLAEQRARYGYVYDYPAGVPMAASVPRGEGFSPLIAVEIAEIKAAIAANRAAATIRSVFASPHGALDAYADIFATIEPPRAAALVRGDAQMQDLVFAWQRVGGANPLSLRRAGAVPEGFPLGEAEFRAALGSETTDSLAAALAEGRLFQVDYSAFDGVPGGAGFGRQRQLPAPRALFLQHRAGELLPLAIAGRPGGPITTPRDGARWRLARAAVQVADANWHELVIHLGQTHFVAEAFALAASRNLDESHPMRALLEPHFEHTLAINHLARTALLAPGGEVESLLAPTLEASLAIIARARRDFSLANALPRRDLRARGVDDPERLVAYPYRDDGLPVWDAIHAFVSAYVALHYAADADVAADPELAAFHAELGASDGGRLAGVPELEGRAALAEIVALMIWIATAQHSAINYPQFEAMAFVPAAPLAAYGPTLGVDGATDADLVTALGPVDAARAQLEFFYQQSRIRQSTLGAYPDDHFRDECVTDLLQRFQARLDAIDAEIAARDARRLLPYPWLRPSRIPASIHI